jgi:Cu-Zn family superoxide dismutase
MSARSHSRFATVLLALVAAALFGCSGGDHDPAADDHGHDHGAGDDHGHDHGDAASSSSTQPAGGQTQAAPTVAAAQLQALGDSGIAGVITFTSVPEGVRVDADVTGLSPGDHGFHVHEFGDCSAVDGKSAGGHFNPHGAAHGALEASPSHVGDFGNLHAGADGHAVTSFVSDKLSVGGGAGSVLGRGVIVHANADDLSSQPSGAAGSRIGCGVIQDAHGTTTPVTSGS